MNDKQDDAQQGPISTILKGVDEIGTRLDSLTEKVVDPIKETVDLAIKDVNEMLKEVIARVPSLSDLVSEIADKEMEAELSFNDLTLSGSVSFRAAPLKKMK